MAAAAAFEEELEISFSSGVDGDANESASSSFLSNLFDPSIVDPSYTTEVPKVEIR